MPPTALLSLLLAGVCQAAAPAVTGDGAVTFQPIPLSEVGFQPAATERPAMGPELYAAGADGVAGLYDPVRREVVLVAEGAAPARIPVGRIDDLAFAGGDLLLLDESARTLTRMSPGGEVLDILPVPALVPPGCRLAVEADEIRARDIFGNRHRMARLDGQGLTEGDGPALVENPSPVRWQSDVGVLQYGAQALTLPDAIKASGQWLDGAQSWLLVDVVVGDMPLVVERRVISGDGALTVTVPLTDAQAAGGAWTPGRAVAVSPEGELLLLLPDDDELRIGRVSR